MSSGVEKITTLSLKLPTHIHTSQSVDQSYFVLQVKEICHHVEKNNHLEEVTFRNVELGELEIQRLAFSLKQSAGGLKVSNSICNVLPDVKMLPCDR